MRGDERGAGVAIGAVILFPGLMLVIVTISAMSDSARVEQALQSTANQVARTATLCCRYTGGTGGANVVAREMLTVRHDAGAFNRIHCLNNVATDSFVIFTDVSGSVVDPTDATQEVPAGGTVTVIVHCEVPPQALGGFGFPGLEVERWAIGTASVDPFRSRPAP